MYQMVLFLRVINTTLIIYYVTFYIEIIGFFLYTIYYCEAYIDIILVRYSVKG